MKERANLLAGLQTPECDYCWRIENLEKDHISDRIYKSSFSWSKPYKDQIIESGLGETFTPTYVEVSFENTCSLRCMYCSPEYSSRWVEDIKTHGPYRLKEYGMHDLEHLKSIGKLPFARDEHNPYVEAFWKWWPDLYPKLHTFRITGGEPLLSKHTFAILDWIEQNPREELTLAINTNMCVPDKIMDAFIEKIKCIQDKVKLINVFTSFEATGSQAEYIRDGLNYSKLISNVERLLSETKQDKVILGVMTTLNNLSVTTFTKFLRQLYDWKLKYSHRDVHRIQYPINYLRYPDFLDIRNLPLHVKEKFAEELRSFVKIVMVDNEHYYPEDFDQIERTISYMMSDDIVQKQKDNFQLFINQYDARRGLNFKETFPELQEMLEA
jgi:MoaA/NifB/PqqE/SkfB family radical SAM enzyme